MPSADRRPACARGISATALSFSSRTSDTWRLTDASHLSQPQSKHHSLTVLGEHQSLGSTPGSELFADRLCPFVATRIQETGGRARSHGPGSEMDRPHGSGTSHFCNGQLWLEEVTLLFLRLQPLETPFSPYSRMSKPGALGCPGHRLLTRLPPASRGGRGDKRDSILTASETTLFSRRGRCKRENAEGGGSCWRSVG